MGISLTRGSTALVTGDVEIGAVEIKDRDSDTRVNFGQQVAAESLPVTIASDQSDVPVTLDGEQIDIGDVCAGTQTNDVKVTLDGEAVDVPTATPTIYNVTLTNADTEYSQAMPTNCRGFEFQCRTENEVRFAFVTGKVAGPTAPYMTLKAGDYYVSFPLNQGGSPSTLYLASSTAGVVVEIVAWT